MPLLNFSCMVVSNSCLEYGKVTTIVTTNFEFAGAAGGEGAGVVGNGEADVCKLPAEGLVSAGGEGVVGEAVVEGVVWAACAEGVVAVAGAECVVIAAGTGGGGSDSTQEMGSRGESSTMARIDVEIMLFEADSESTKRLLLPGAIACVVAVLVRIELPTTHGGATLRTTVMLVPSMSVISIYSPMEAV